LPFISNTATAICRALVEEEKALIIANCRIKRPAGLSSLREMAANHTAYEYLVDNGK